MVTSFVRKIRRASVASQGQWMNGHGVETRKISWGALNSLLEPLMMFSQLHRISVSGWAKTKAASCVWVFLAH